jgi:hypothetical protein
MHTAWSTCETHRLLSSWFLPHQEFGWTDTLGIERIELHMRSLLQVLTMGQIVNAASPVPSNIPRNPKTRDDWEVTNSTGTEVACALGAALVVIVATFNFGCLTASRPEKKSMAARTKTISLIFVISCI